MRAADFTSGGLSSREAARPALAPSPRNDGKVRLSFKCRGAVSALDTLFQSGCLRARILRSEPGRNPEAVLLNTAGGLTGGDRLWQTISWGKDTHATVTTQACEKVYRALTGEARVQTLLEIEDGATGEWLPQETILFDRAALHRDLQVRLGMNAVFTGLEAVVLGRTAMGEQVHRARFQDRWRIWRDKRLIYADAFELGGDIAALLARAPVTQSRIAFASLIHAGPEAEGSLAAVRALLPAPGCVAGASAWNGLLAVRIVAAGNAHLRAALVRVLESLRAAPLPRVWQI